MPQVICLSGRSGDRIRRFNVGKMTYAKIQNRLTQSGVPPGVFIVEDDVGRWRRVTPDELNDVANQDYLCYAKQHKYAREDPDEQISKSEIHMYYVNAIAKRICNAIYAQRTDDALVLIRAGPMNFGTNVRSNPLAKATEYDNKEVFNEMVMRHYIEMVDSFRYDRNSNGLADNFYGYILEHDWDDILDFAIENIKCFRIGRDNPVMDMLCKHSKYAQIDYVLTNYQSDYVFKSDRQLQSDAKAKGVTVYDLYYDRVNVDDNINKNGRNRFLGESIIIYAINRSDRQLLELVLKHGIQQLDGDVDYALSLGREQLAAMLIEHNQVEVKEPETD